MISTQRPHYPVASLSDPGLTGKQNEDRLAVASYRNAADRPVLFAVVCDGIGGHLAGEVAADLAVQEILKDVGKSSGSDPLRTMESAIHSASQAIASNSASIVDRTGMGATCACIWIDGDRLYTAHVGDSRIYLLRDHRIQPLTIDHTWIQEALEKGIITPEQVRGHPNAHVLRRHLGSVELPEVDFRLHLDHQEGDQPARLNQGMHLQPGDILLVCSDGLTDLVWDAEILRLITTRNNLQSAAEDLVARANERGGLDNVTVVLVGVPNVAAPDSRRKRGWVRSLFDS